MIYRQFLLSRESPLCRSGYNVSVYCHACQPCVTLVTLSFSTVVCHCHGTLIILSVSTVTCVTFVSIWLHCHSIVSTVSLWLHCQILLSPSNHSDDTGSFFCQVCHLCVPGDIVSFYC